MASFPAARSGRGLSVEGQRYYHVADAHFMFRDFRRNFPSRQLSVVLNKTQKCHFQVHPETFNIASLSSSPFSPEAPEGLPAVGQSAGLHSRSAA